MVKKIKKYKADLNKIKEHFQKSGGSEGKWFSIKAPPKGEVTKVTFRILPPWGESADGFYYFTGALHYGFTVGGVPNRTLPCLESVGKGKCPICKFIAALKGSDDKAHQKLADRIRRSDRYWMNVIDREEPDRVKIFGANRKFIDAIIDATDDEDIGDITDPETGRDIIASRRGATKNTTRYTYRVRTKSTPVKFKYKDLYQLDTESMDDLSYKEVLQYMLDNYEDEVREVGLRFKGMADIDDDDDEDEKPKKKSKKPKKVKKIVKKKKRVIEEEDEDEDIDEDDDMDIDEDDDEDEDIDESEDIEDEEEDEDEDED